MPCSVLRFQSDRHRERDVIWRTAEPYTPPPFPTGLRQDSELSDPIPTERQVLSDQTIIGLPL